MMGNRTNRGGYETLGEAKHHDDLSSIEDPQDKSARPPVPAAKWEKAWAKFKKSNDMESTRVNHHYTPEERLKLHSVESIDYLPANSDMYRKWLIQQPHRRVWDRWLMMGMIGVTTGFITFCLSTIIHTLTNVKYGTTRWLISHSNMGVAWLFNVTISLLLVAASSALVVGVAPEACGSGIPEVMAYLNGVLLPKVFNVYTLFVKFLSCALAVSSGLPVGPEGPLIHIGAALGAALSQGHSTTMQVSSDWFKRFRNPKDKRDFVTAGVSVGVAAAFNAPIGGLLFALEEVASFWQNSLGWQVFFATMCAVLTVQLLKSAVNSWMGHGMFGYFNSGVTFEVDMSISTHILSIPPAIVLGLAAGILAVIFTVVNVKVVRMRDNLLAGLKWKRMIEPCVFTVLFVTTSMILPLFFPCTSTECIGSQGELNCNSGLSNSTLPRTSQYAHSEDLLPLYTCKTAIIHSNISDAGQLSGGGRHLSWVPNAGSLHPGDDNVTSVTYNELATLLLTTGEEGIKHLFTRGTHRRFSYKALFVMLVYYFFSAALCSGSALSSGLFVPMLLIGALLGRIFGLVIVDMSESLGHLIGQDILTSGPWSWIDPGVFALVGAGAFMGGVTRLTVALAVIMMEVSSDVHTLLPVLVAIMTAKWVADAACHPLYHRLLEVKCVPFLAPEPVSKLSLDLVPVSTVMHKPVVTLRTEMKVREISQTLQMCNHNGFPIVRVTPSGDACVGLVTRPHLIALLQRILATGVVNGLEVPWQELNRKVMDPVQAQMSAAEQQLADLARHMHEEVANGGPQGVMVGEQVVDLKPYMSTSGFKVSDSFSLERAYILFRTMGLRHLVVVDDQNRVQGIVTRKDLLGYRLDHALHKALGAQLYMRRHSRQYPQRPQMQPLPISMMHDSARLRATNDSYDD